METDVAAHAESRLHGGQNCTMPLQPSAQPRNSPRNHLALGHGPESVHILSCGAVFGGKLRFSRFSTVSYLTDLHL
eukprot:scaffold1554_cov261-Pinguiococcus_pyrenoidosus.AAC.9